MREVIPDLESRYRTRVRLLGSTLTEWCEFTTPVILFDRKVWTTPDATLPGVYRSDDDWCDVNLSDYTYPTIASFLRYDMVEDDYTDSQGNRSYGYLHGPTLGLVWDDSFYTRSSSYDDQRSDEYIVLNAPFNKGAWPSWIRDRVSPDPLTTEGEFSLLWRDSLRTSVEHTADYVTKNWNECRRNKVIVNNPCARYANTHVLQCIHLFVEASRIDVVREQSNPNQDHYVLGSPSGYMHLEVYAPWPEMIRYDSQYVDLFSKFFGASEDPILQEGTRECTIDGTLFGEYSYSLDQHTVLAADSAARGAMDLLTTVGEMPQTITMFVAISRKAVTMLKALKALKQGNMAAYRKHFRKVFPKGVIRKLKASSNVWLEYRYGWRQLFFDIRNALEAIRKTVAEHQQTTFSWAGVYNPHLVKSDPTHLVSEISTQREGGTGIKSIGSVSTSFGSISGVDITYYGLISVNSGVAIDRYAEEGLLKRLDRYLGSLQIGRTAWDLIPLSFVIDRYVAIGSAIGAMGLDPKLIARQWQTFQVLPFDGNTSLKFNVGYPDLRDYLVKACFGHWDVPCASIFGANVFNNDDLAVHFELTSKCSVYIREIPSYPTVLPSVVPLGSHKHEWQYVLDLIAIFVARRLIR